MRRFLLVLCLFASIRLTTSSPVPAQSSCHFLYLPIVTRWAPAVSSTISVAATAHTSTNPCLPPYVGGAIPISAPTYGIQPGLASIIQPPSYNITANTSKAYRLVWSGSMATQRFYGSIWSTGTFTSFMPGCADSSCLVGSSGTISSPVNLNGGGQRIDFDTVPGQTLVGLDFVVSAEPVYFDVFLNGARDPAMVYFPATANGGVVSNPGTIPFALTTH